MLVSEQDIKTLALEKARKRLYELSLKTVGEVPQLNELNEEQAAWTKKRMKSGRWEK